MKESEVVDKINIIMSKLVINSDNSDVYDNTEFVNGRGYIQHNTQVVNEITLELIKLANDSNYLDLVDEELIELKGLIPCIEFRQKSGIGRYLSGNIFGNAWSKIVRITNNGREYGQVYFALNPHEATVGCVNNYFRNDSIDKLLG